MRPYGGPMTSHQLQDALMVHYMCSCVKPIVPCHETLEGSHGMTSLRKHNQVHDSCRAQAPQLRNNCTIGATAERERTT